MQQLGPDMRLEKGDGPAHRRRRSPDPPARARKAAFLHGRNKHFHRIDAVHGSFRCEPALALVTMRSQQDGTPPVRTQRPLAQRLQSRKNRPGFLAGAAQGCSWVCASDAERETPQTPTI
jgi:hypothetical protein